MRGRQGPSGRTEGSASAAQGGGTPSGGCLEAALLTRRPRSGPPEPRGSLGPTVPARPSTSSPEWRRRRPGILLARGARPWGSCRTRAGERRGRRRGRRPRARRSAEAQRRGRACSRGRRADCAGAWLAPLAAPRGPPVMRWPALAPLAGLAGRRSLASTRQGDLLSVKFFP